jgi:hypothetical protein
VRVLSSVYADSRAPLLFTDNDNNEGVHFVEKTRLSIVGEMSRLDMNLNKALSWNHESSANFYLRRANHNLRLLKGRLLLDNYLWLLLIDWLLLNNYLWLLLVGWLLLDYDLRLLLHNRNASTG